MTEESSKNTPRADVPRYLSAYGEGAPLPPMQTEEDREKFECQQRIGWQERSS